MVYVKIDIWIKLFNKGKKYCMKRKLMIICIAAALMFTSSCIYNDEYDYNLPETENMDGTEESEEIEVIEVEDNLYTDKSFGSDLYENDKAYEALCDSLMSMKDEIKLSGYKVPSDKLPEFYNRIIYQNPHIFWAKTGYSGTERFGYIYTVKPNYISGVTESIIEETNAKVNEIIRTHITDSMTDAEKALVLHDYIIHNTKYELAGENSYNAYGVLMENKGVCQGYVMAYGWLLDKCGIDWEYVSSESMNHGWTHICLDGDWYNIDVTWDDPVGEGDFCGYDYFLKSDYQFKYPVYGEKNHYDWSAIYECGGGKYSDEMWCYTNASNDDMIIKYNDGRYCYRENVYIESTKEIPKGIKNYYKDSSGRMFYKVFTESDFDGKNYEVKSQKYYESIDYPYDN